MSPVPVPEPVPGSNSAAGEGLGGSALHGLRARFVRGVGWNLVALVFTQGGTFVLNLILANVWGVRTFGRYAIVQSTLTTLTAVVQATAGTTATKYVAELRAQDPARAGRVLGLCAVISGGIAFVAAGVLLFASDAIATDALHAPDISPVLMIASVAALFNMMCAFLAGGLAGLESYRVLGRAGALTGVLTVVITASTGRAWGIPGAVGGLAVSAAIQWIVLFMALRSESASHGIHIALREGRRELAVFSTFLAPAALISLWASPAVWVSNVLLVQQPDGDRQMAIFAAANSFRILVLFSPTIVGNVGLSLLNNQRGAAHERRFRRVFWTNLTVNAALVTTGAVAVALGAPWLLGLFGREFGAGYTVLIILMCAALPETLSTATIQLIQSRERVWLSLVAVILPSYGTLALGAWLLTPALGARGLAWSYVAAMTVSLAASSTVISRIGMWDADRAPAVEP